jgi:chondroitin AC lyase
MEKNHGVITRKANSLKVIFDCVRRNTRPERAFWGLIGTVLLLLPSSFCFAADLDTLYSRLRAEYIVHGSSSSAASYLSGQQADGSFTGVSYTSTEPLSRLHQMAVAYATPGNASYNSPTMLNGILNGLTYWFQSNHTNSNWWFNDIGYQLDFGPIGVLLRPNLPKNLIDNISIQLRRPVYAATGQNLLWYGEKIVWSAVLNNSMAEMDTAKKLMNQTIVVATGVAEGIKPDWSFWQHGNMLAMGAYGFEYIRDMSFWMYALHGLSFSFARDQVSTFSAYFLDGVQWAIHKGYLDWTVTGRYLVRGGWTDQRSELTLYCNYMMAADAVRKSEYQKLLSYIQNGTPASLTGDKHFWVADYHSHKREGYSIGLKIMSTRTKIPESTNGENSTGFYLAAGSTFLSVNGDEYYNVFSSQWDWSLIPGTTVPHRNPAPDPGSRMGLNAFAGGASDSVYGVVGYDLNWDGVTGKKAWFFFDDQFVALGNSISSALTLDINTTVNQTLKKGDALVEYGAGAGTAVTGSSILNNPKWVYHNKFGYIFPQSASINLQTASLFTLYFNHGQKPANASYAYIGLPNATASQVQSFAGNDPVNIISNTVTTQAVYHSTQKIGGIVFYKAGSVALRPDMTVTVSKPCIMLVTDKSNGIHVTIANPERKADTVTTTIDQNANGKETSGIILPGGEPAGTSVTKVFFAKASPVKFTSQNHAISSAARFLRYAHGRLEIVPENNVAYEIVVNSLDGKQVARWHGKGNTIGPKLKPGVYTLQMFARGTIPQKSMLSVIGK